MDLSLFLADMESRFDQQRRDEHDEMLIEMLDAERATVSYAERLLATLHREIELTLRGGQRLKGRVGDVALQWIRLEGERDQHIIPLHAIVAAVGLGAPTTNADSPAYRVSIGHLLRGLGERRAALVIDHDAGQYSGRLQATYADHFDIVMGGRDSWDLRDQSPSATVSLSLLGVQKITLARHWQG